APGVAVDAQQIRSAMIPGLSAARLVFVDGFYRPELSDLGDPARQATVCELSETPQVHRDTVERLLDDDGEQSSAAFTRLNAAMLSGGLFIHVPDRRAVKQPVYLLYLTTAGTNGPVITNPRSIILLGREAQLTVVEHYVGLTDHVYLTNAVTQIVASAGAVVRHYLIEQEGSAAYQVSTLMLEQERDSDAASHTALLGSRLVRNNINPRLNGQGGQCLVNGLYVGASDQHLDNHMRVEHNAPHCDSRQFYHGVLTDQAHAVFSGRIVVAPGAQKTDAKQNSANLLLSPTAQATTKPQLEIYADDVKCTHGATVGQIDEDAVFYLMSRGLTQQAARGLLIYAFAAQSLDRMELEPLRRWLAGALLERLPQGQSLAELVQGDELEGEF
ncbi:MAG TPA: Fe-S cluster assembly protein SufD, partial [Phycisphaeraceae bacterium]